jgi:hypothetical protein
MGPQRVKVHAIRTRRRRGFGIGRHDNRVSKCPTSTSVVPSTERDTCP